MKECLSEDTLQAYFDGELAENRMESTALHLAGCKTCSAAFGELKSEADLVFSALAPEFEGAVPTERLHRRIDAAIGGLQVVGPRASQTVSPGRRWFDSVSAFLTFSPQRTFGYAGLAAVLTFAVILGLSRIRTAPQVAPSQTASAPVTNPRPVPAVSPTVATNAEVANAITPVVHRAKKINRSTTLPTQSANPAVAAVKLLPGERSYLKTIAALDNTIQSGKRTMRPSLQAEYERNLALVDRAIAATRSAAKRNPNDPDAADFMFSAYQSKVDLLNTIADARAYNRPR